MKKSGLTLTQRIINFFYTNIASPLKLLMCLALPLDTHPHRSSLCSILWFTLLYRGMKGRLRVVGRGPCECRGAAP